MKTSTIYVLVAFVTIAVFVTAVAVGNVLAVVGTAPLTLVLLQVAINRCIRYARSTGTKS